jgi:hypothetical protein
VIDRLDKPETVIVAVLGLVYVAIRSSAIGQYITSVGQIKFLAGQIVEVRKLLNDPNSDELTKEKLEADVAVPRVIFKFYIDWFFLWIIGLYCLLVVFTNVRQH